MTTPILMQIKEGVFRNMNFLSGFDVVRDEKTMKIKKLALTFFGGEFIVGNPLDGNLLLSRVVVEDVDDKSDKAEKLFDKLRSKSLLVL